MTNKAFEVVEYIGTLGTKKDKKGNKVEIRLQKVRWGAGVQQWDLRAWDENGNPGKGMTLTTRMVNNLYKILKVVKEEEK
jgi:Uncharacterized protein conserved in bacteria